VEITLQHPDHGCDLLTVAPLDCGAHEVALLQERTGKALLWDVRTPDPVPIFDFREGLQENITLLASTMDPQNWTVFAASAGTLHCGDVRIQRTSAVAVPVATSEEPPFLTIGARGGLLAAWLTRGYAE